MLEGKVIAIFGFMNKLIAWSVRISPRATLRSIAAGLNRNRNRKNVP